jgi:integrase
MLRSPSPRIDNAKAARRPEDLDLRTPNTTQKLVPYRKPKASPALAYLSTLSEGKSRDTMTLSLKTVASLFQEAGLFPTADPFTAPWETLAFEDVAGLRGRLQATYAPAGANLRLYALRGVLKACAAQGTMTFEDKERAILGARPITGSREVAGRALEPTELGRLFLACSDDSAVRSGPPVDAIRDRAMLVVLYGLGLRRSEAAALEAKDVAIDGSTLKVIGKGNKERLGHVPAGAMGMFRAWLDVAPKKGPVFGLTASGIYQRLVRLGTIADVEVTPHDMRRSFATNLLDLGVDAMTASKMMGHSNVQTTMRYDRRTGKERKKAADGLTFDFEAAGRQRRPPT